jgi:hypothetical protein
MTLIPGGLDVSLLRCQTHNGGRNPEIFDLQSDVNHSKPVSFLISATQALGVTDGRIVIFDQQTEVQACIKKEQQALIGMLIHQRVSDTSLTRFFFSALEHDDTSKPTELTPFRVDVEYAAKSTKSL